MKKTSLPKLMATTMLLVTSTYLNAQVNVIHEVSSLTKDMSAPGIKQQVDMKRYDLAKDDGVHKMYIPKKTSLKHKAPDADMVTVTCKLEYEEGTYTPCGHILVKSENYEGNFFSDYEDGTPNTIICSVPIGIHDFLTDAWLTNGGMAVVVKEQVDIKSDMTLVFHLADATNKYTIETYKPNGDLCKEWIKDPKESFDIIQSANIDMYYDVIRLNLKGVGCMERLNVESNLIKPGDNAAYTFYTNELSDRYRLAIARFVADDTWYICKYETENMGQQVLKNNPNDFLCYQEQFSPTPVGNPENGGGIMMMKAVITLDNLNEDLIEGQTDVKAADNTVVMYIDAPKSTELDEGHIDIFPCAGFGDECVVVQVEDREGIIHEENNYGTIYGQFVILNENGIQYINAGHDQCGERSFHRSENGDLIEYPGHPAFGYTDKQKLLFYGTNCPINSINAQNYYNAKLGGYLGKFTCAYIGRYGEVRNVDTQHLTTEVKYNGEIICNDYLSQDYDMFNFFMEKNTNGVIDAQIINENVVVEGLAGKNVTIMHYNWGADDMTAPTLQMLWFKNQEGNVIDRFDIAENGTLEFAGGDFNYQNVKPSYFDCKEQTVEVNYSPYNKNEWSVLEVEEIPENFYMPGFGYFYRGSLKDVTGTGEKGWFDLKIRLEDEAGNWQEQVISPAFRIDDLVDTGIENIEHSGLSIEHSGAVYDVMGRRVSNGQCSMVNTQFNKGIRIIRKPNGDVRKVVVR